MPQLVVIFPLFAYVKRNVVSPCRAIIWAGTKEDVFVHFSNIRNLVCPSWGERKCMRLQNDMVKHTSATSREKYLEMHIRAASNVRYIHFPMCFKSHWTLVLYDTEDGVWKYYNSLRPRNRGEDIHYKEALVLKEQVLNYVRRARQAVSHEDVVAMQDGDRILESIVDYPLDCAIIVCYIMRQYIHHIPIKRTMEDTNCIGARVTMVRAFVGDPIHGMKDGSDDNRG
ncbi:hypothetical protein CsSME_00028102 [Camellia sinensis var. sinensis]